MASKENAAKVRRLRKAVVTIEADLRELFFLPPEQVAPIRAAIEFISKRCDALEASDLSEESDSE